MLTPCQFRGMFLAPVARMVRSSIGIQKLLIEDYSHMDHAPNESTGTKSAGVPSPDAKYAIVYFATILSWHGRPLCSKKWDKADRKFFSLRLCSHHTSEICWHPYMSIKRPCQMFFPWLSFGRYNASAKTDYSLTMRRHLAYKLRTSLQKSAAAAVV